MDGGIQLRDRKFSICPRRAAIQLTMTEVSVGQLPEALSGSGESVPEFW
jgi:hypothetical protein